MPHDASRLVPSYDYRGTLSLWEVRGAAWVAGPVLEVPGGLSGERLAEVVEEAVRARGAAPPAAPPSCQGDVAAALRSLGYGARAARSAVAQAGGGDAQAVLRSALAALARGG